MYRSPSKGFTFSEILVVLAIFAILSAILFAVFGRAKESGHRTNCQNNLKQISLAIQQYTQDNNSQYPPNDREGAMQPYLTGTLNKNIFDCPSDPGPKVYNGANYVYNQRLIIHGIDGNRIGISEAVFQEPSTMWLEHDWPFMSNSDEENFYKQYIRLIANPVV